MKNVFKTLLILTLLGLSTLFAGMVSSEILFVPWGESEQELQHRSYPGLHTGPMSFQVENDLVTIFDTENQKLKTYRENEMISSKALEDPYILDFHMKDGRLYTMDPKNIYVRENGVKRTVASIDDPIYMFDGLKNENGAIVSSSPEGKVLCSTGQLNKGIATDIKVTRTLPATVNVRINGRMHELHVPDVGSVEYIGSTPDGRHYIYAESITKHVPLAVERMILLIDNEGHILNTLYLPDQKFTYIFKEFYVDDESILYHMQSSKDGIHILKWEYVNDNEDETFYPAEFSESYHFNEFIQPEPEIETPPALMKTSDAAVTRAEAIAIGGEYVTHVWTATSSNIGTIGNATTPSWVSVGENTRVPYKWGGWSTVAQFDAGISSGLLAGDVNTSAVDWGNSVGADCSGFVSVCWRASQKYGTSTIHNCSHELSSYNDLLPGDATNKAGSHIRLVVEWTTDGRLRQVEETASGTPGWAARYYTWRLSDITAYVPIRYNKIQNSLAPRPTLLSVISKQDSVTLDWDANESTIFSGYRIYGKTRDEEYAVLGEVPKGVQTATITQPDDYYFQYFVAGYTSDDSANYNPSDIYAAKRTDAAKQILLVDGFDRSSGSYGYITHSFVAKTALSMDRFGVNFDACANEAVISGDVDLNNYEMVWWICGDESTADETFNDTEQDIVEAYLDSGGKLFVSGSEIGWDLDNSGSTSDKAFIHNYLKTSYSEDDAGSYQVNGVSTTVFNGIDLVYSSDGSGENTYEEDYPDAFSATGGSQVVLKYGNGKNAAVAYSGAFPGGTLAGKVMVMGFPFETIKSLDECESLSGAILQYMNITTHTSTDPIIPSSAKLHQNYPNPFNPLTTIAYELNKPAVIDIRIYNIKGEEVEHIAQGQRPAGEHKIIFNGTMFPSGMYVYGLEINGETVEVRKMTLMK